MSLYISKENQDLLWNFVNNNNIVKQYFNNNTSAKAQWFKDIIKNIYEKYYNVHISIDMLQTINRETVTYMINDIRNKFNGSNTTQFNYDKPSNVNNLFQTRQSEYQQLINPSAPKEINFQEDEEQQLSFDDIKMQYQARKEELNKTLNNSAQPPINIDQSTNISMDDKLSTIQYVNKKVSWVDDIKNEENKNYIDNINTQINELIATQKNILEKYQKLEQYLNDNKEEVTELRKELNDIKNKIK